MRIMKTAKDYVKRHESELKEKLDQNKSLGSYIKTMQLVIIRFFQTSWRLTREFLGDITPWQQRIKDIESHFGSVVSSYFIFLRWIFWMNFAITVVLTIFVIIPEVSQGFLERLDKKMTFPFFLKVLAADWEGTGARKKMLPVESHYAFNLKVMWDFEGIMRYSPIFYGYFSSKPHTKAGYQIPLAYFCSGMSVYIFRLVVSVR